MTGGIVSDVADAEADRVTARVVRVAPLERLLHAFDRLADVGRVDRAQQHDELVAAEPGDHVAVAQRAGERLRERLQCTVAFRMAAAIVDRLETVQVEEQQCRLPARALAQAEHLTRENLEAAPVCQLRQLVGGREMERRDFAFGHVGEIAEQRELVGAQLTRPRIDQAQRADRRAVRRGKRTACVEANAGLAGDERVVVETIVVERVLDDHRVVREQRMRAERHVARSLRGVEPRMTLEPLAVLVDEAHDSDRHVEQPAREARDAVEAFFGRRVENRQ